MRLWLKDIIIQGIKEAKIHFRFIIFKYFYILLTEIIKKNILIQTLSSILLNESLFVHSNYHQEYNSMPKFIIIHIKVHMNPAPGHFSVTLTVVYFRHVRVLTCFWLKIVLMPSFICVVRGRGGQERQD